MQGKYLAANNHLANIRWCQQNNFRFYMVQKKRQKQGGSFNIRRLWIVIKVITHFLSTSSIFLVLNLNELISVEYTFIPSFVTGQQFKQNNTVFERNNSWDFKAVKKGYTGEYSIQNTRCIVVSHVLGIFYFYISLCLRSPKHLTNMMSLHNIQVLSFQFFETWAN